MPIEFACECGRRLKVADEHAGKRAKCPGCGSTVAVPAAPVAVAEVPASAEDEAFRALSEGPDPDPVPRSSWQVPARDAPPPRPLPKSDAGSYAARALAQTQPLPKPDKKKAKSSYRDPYAPPERKWSVNWGKVIGGGLGVLLGCALLFGGLAAGRFFIWSPVIIIGGIVGVINGLLSKE